MCQSYAVQKVYLHSEVENNSLILQVEKLRLKEVMSPAHSHPALIAELGFKLRLWHKCPPLCSCISMKTAGSLWRDLPGASDSLIDFSCFPKEPGVHDGLQSRGQASCLCHMQGASHGSPENTHPAYTWAWASSLFALLMWSELKVIAMNNKWAIIVELIIPKCYWCLCW